MDSSGTRILIVDDDESIRAVLTRALEGAGFEVWCAEGPEEALETFAASPQPPHLVVVDYDMPGMSGLELAAVLREQAPGLPIVMLSGSTAIDGLKPALESGVLSDFVKKPWRSAKLIAVIEGLLDR